MASTLIHWSSLCVVVKLVLEGNLAFDEGLAGGVQRW